MNLLILSPGTRVETVCCFVRQKNTCVVCADASEYAPALYAGDAHYLIPRIDEEGYLEAVMEICKKERINGLISLIDPEITLLSQQAEIFDSLNVKLIMPPKEAIENCFDKMKMHDFCIKNGIPTIPTYGTLASFEEGYCKGDIDFPVFIKPVCGSASNGVQKIETLEELQQELKQTEIFLIQAFMTGPEYGVDAYVDLISGEIVEFFMKKKMNIGGAETEKGHTIHNDSIEKIARDFLIKNNCRGPMDLDIFEHEGKFYLTEANPRFGGGYPFADACGTDFPKLIVNNLMGEINQPTDFEYQDHIKLMKCYSPVLVSPET